MWIKLHRSLTEWEWFNKSEMVQIFIYLLLKANYEDRKWQGIIIKKGQILTNYSVLQIELNISLQKARTCLERLKSTGEILVETTRKHLLITVCNFDKYQEYNSFSNTIATRLQHDCNTETTTTKEIKEVKNNNLSTYNAHAREDTIPPDLQDCYNILSTDRSWHEAVLMNIHSRGYRHIMFEQLDEYLTLFFQKLKADGTDFKQPRDAKQHFSNWLLIQLEKQKNESNRNPHSRKQEANAYALSQFTDYYTNMDEEIPNPFID